MELDLLPMMLGLWLVACASPPPTPTARPAPAPASAPASAPPSTGTPTVASAEPAPAASAEPAPASAPTPAAPSAPDPLPEGTVVLHIGDSMAGALGVALNDELKQHKVKGILRFKTASYIPGWAGGQELPLHLSQMKPDLVLITLGTNEVKMPDPTQRAPLVKKIVKLIGDRPCVWLAPPIWTDERGLYQVIRDNVAPCRYMDTEVVYPGMPRLGDKIHPTINARKEWAKRVVAWLAKERRPATGKPWALRAE
ncbi:MAG: SGNH/GDSL hydrolase family protein [Polyangiaceae bacterium]|nr:SGNH/GDSL hydrolase family protein [Polyangiaceae bacterium]